MSSEITAWKPYGQKWLSNSLSDGSEFSVLSYNVYHDYYISQTPAQLALLDPELHSSEFRNERIMDEINVWKPDIVVLQEMDVGYFHKQWLPRMGKFGYAGHIAVGPGPPQTCCVALFYKVEIFDLKHVECISMEDLIKEQLPELEQQFRVLRHPMIHIRVVNFCRLYHRISQRQVQIAGLHLTWDEFHQPLYHCLEALAVLRKAQALAKECPLIVAGDFNCRPHDPECELISKGCVGKDRQTLFQNEINKDEDLLKNIIDKLQNPLPLKSAYNEYFGVEDKLTTYEMVNHDWIVYTLDYIWFAEGRGLHLNGVLEIPTRETVTRFDGLPNQLFPSDHLPVGAKFRFGSEL